MAATAVITVDLVVEVAAALSDPVQAFLELCRLLPRWGQLLASQLEVTKISGAMSNLVFVAHNTAATLPDSQRAIIRLFGKSSPLFSRQHERGIFQAAADCGFGPKCLLEFSNGRVEEFVEGDVVTASSMRRISVAAAIATSLADFHVSMFDAMKKRALDLSSHGAGAAEEPQDQLWERLRAWLVVAATVAPKEVAELGLSGAAEEVDAFRAKFEGKFGRQGLLAFTHNDLQYGNIILQRNSQGYPVARLIDYEYSTFGDVGFDLGNHFAEYAADYHKLENKSALDWDRLPTKAELFTFTRAYVGTLHLRHHASALTIALMASIDQEAEQWSPDGAAAKKLNDRAFALMPLSHLLWGVWGLIQSKTAEIEFDFEGYARERLAQYHETKRALLG